VALEETVQSRARERREGVLQGVEAIVERQLRLLAKGHGFLLRREHRRGGPGPHRSIGRRPLAPFRNRFDVDTVPLGYALCASLTWLNTASYSRRCPGAAGKNLSHN